MSGLQLCPFSLVLLLKSGNECFKNTLKPHFISILLFKYKRLKKSKQAWNVESKNVESRKTKFPPSLHFHTSTLPKELGTDISYLLLLSKSPQNLVAQNSNKHVLFLAFSVGQEFRYGAAGGHGAGFLMRFRQRSAEAWPSEGWTGAGGAGWRVGGGCWQEASILRHGVLSQELLTCPQAMQWPASLRANNQRARALPFA